MKFVVRTFDNKNKLSIRKKFMENHLSYLAKHKDEILVAGSLRPTVDEYPIGAIRIKR